MSFPECQECAVGVLVPLSDYGSLREQESPAAIVYKAWVCTKCDYTIKIRNGDIYKGHAVFHEEHV